MRIEIEGGANLCGKVTIPGDKSISHRVAIVSSLARGMSEVSGFSTATDCLRTIDCLKQLGVDIEFQKSSVLIDGRGDRGLVPPNGALDAGNSGTTMRLLAGALAAEPFTSRITGDESLLTRPMMRIIEPLRLMGAKIKSEDREGHPPLEISGGNLRGIVFTPSIPSAQVKSAILLAGMRANGKTIVRESIKTRDHTERLLSYTGISITREEESIILEPGIPQAKNLKIPGDFSSAAFLVAAALICPDSEVRIERVSLNPTRTGFIRIVREMGADIETNTRRNLWEPEGDLIARTSELNSIEIGKKEVSQAIDEIPLVALLACMARGKTVIRGARELRVKESDRISGTAKGLLQMGASVEEHDDGMDIYGPCKLNGASVSSQNDHRLALLFAVAGLAASGKTSVEGWEWTKISFPDFEAVIEELKR
ncbi:MAG: 3-phosphoshikimate 1-carboxyvinyltransferase [Actinomycetota bacterium]|nr:3-phosphoshikimate 1-carboxyvinyltransferase [Actinomycetota bacterium]